MTSRVSEDGCRRPCTLRSSTAHRWARATARSGRNRALERLAAQGVTGAPVGAERSRSRIACRCSATGSHQNGCGPTGSLIDQWQPLEEDQMTTLSAQSRVGSGTSRGHFGPHRKDGLLCRSWPSQPTFEHPTPTWWLCAKTLACRRRTWPARSTSSHGAGSVARSNTEGTIPTHAVPFEANTLNQLRHAGCLTPGAAAALHLAWQHRRQLLPPWAARQPTATA